MKRTLLLAALLGAFATSHAQLVQNDTPPIASVYELKLTSDGSTILALNAYTLAERYFALPFGLDFNAGHGVWLGTRTSLKAPGEAQGVLGYEIYGSKEIGGDGMFILGALGLCVGPRTANLNSLTGFLSLSAGKRF